MSRIKYENGRLQVQNGRFTVLNIVEEAVNEIIWESQTDWDRAQSREGVVTRDVGIRDPDKVQLGYDPNYSPFIGFDHYWSMDQSSGPFTDEIGDFDLTPDGDGSNITGDSSGPLNSAAVFTENDAFIETDGIDTSTNGDFTFGGWVRIPSHPNDFSAGIALNDLSSEESVSLGIWDEDGEFKIGSVGNTPGTGSVQPEGEWIHMILRYDSENNNLEGFIDGIFDYDVNPDDGEDWIPDLDILSVGNRPVGSNSPLEAYYSDVFITEQYLSDSVIESIYDNSFDGFLETDSVLSDGEFENIKIVAETKDNTSADVIIKQDTDSDGTANNEETISVSDGENTYDLTNFSDEESDYWVEIDLSTTDILNTTTIDQIELWT